MFDIYLFITLGGLASLVLLTGDFLTGTAFWQSNNERP
jgi:hypothetical protein